MAEFLRAAVFTTLEMENGDWDGPHPQGDFLIYTATGRTGVSSLTVKLNGHVVFDHDYSKGKVILIDDDVIHLPEGAVGQ